MGTIAYPLDPKSAEFLAATTPEPVEIAGSAFPVWGLAFPSGGNKQIFFKLGAEMYGGGTLTLDIQWASRTGSTTGNVQWVANIAAITPGDAISVFTKTLATSQNTTTTVNSTASGNTRTRVIITNLDSLSSGDVLFLCISRGTDTMTGDALWLRATLTYDDGTIYGLPPLLNDITYYVDSSAGNDVNSGDALSPWQTLARAWQERLKFSNLFAKMIVQLVGAGPYPMTLMGASICGTGGFFIIKGDQGAESVSYTGTFTGPVDTPTFVVNTSSGMGLDTYKGQFVRVTSGAAYGAIFQIVTHTDATMTVNRYTGISGLQALVNGDTFKIFLPGTQVNCSTAGSGQPTPCPTDWVGGIASLNQPANYPQHIFFDVKFINSKLQMINCVAGLIACWSTVGTLFSNSRVWMGGMLDCYALEVGADSATNLLQGAGYYHTGSFGMTIADGTTLVGCLYMDNHGFVLGFQSANDVFLFYGGRIDGTMSIGSNGYLEHGDTSAYTYWGRQVSITRGKFRLSGGPAKFALSSGSCIRASYGGEAHCEAGANISGGTTSVSAYGCDAADGGRIYWKNHAPTLTGGTSGSDIHVNGTAAANSTLAANGNSLVDANTFSGVIRIA